MIYISLTINIILVVLLVVICRRALDVYFRVEESFMAIESFREHLDMVHGLETFYGDDTLGALIEHSKELSDFLRETQEEYSLVGSENKGETTDAKKEEE
tara:strand:+ start:154 stop:453 length:300 start_codon:yes stop_codon:yes gene_type:complete